MAIIEPKGLPGLKGLNKQKINTELSKLNGTRSASKEEFDQFYNDNIQAIAQHNYDPIFINNLYKNKQFIDKYGMEAFKATPGMKNREAIFKHDIINSAFADYAAPYNDKGQRDNRIGLGTNWEKYNSQLSDDAKLKLMQSEYLNPSAFDQKWEEEYQKNRDTKLGGNGILSLLGASGGTVPGASQALIENSQFGTDVKRKAKDANNLILQRIYEDDAENTADKLNPYVQQAYTKLLNLSDEEIKRQFIRAITHNSYNGNLGIPEYEARYGKGTSNDIRSEMQDFSIDDMRKVIAKKEVYDQMLPPDMAMTVLNKQAKRYTSEHEGMFKKGLLLSNDILISSLSYNADKFNSIGEIGRIIQDGVMEKPIVMVDTNTNEIIDPNKIKVQKDKAGRLFYLDEDRNKHIVNQEQISRTALHNLGKNEDGSDIEGAFGIDWLTLNPKYWSRAEQFGTLDPEEQKQYEEIGASPYQVAWDPNNEGSLLYEAFKMTAFRAGDLAIQLMPFGLGLVGKGLQSAEKLGPLVTGLGKVLNTVGKGLTFQSKTGQVVNGLLGAGGISYAYQRGAFPEMVLENQENLEAAIVDKARTNVYDNYHKNKKYKAYVDQQINKTAELYKQDYLSKLRQEGGMKPADMAAIDKICRAKAQDYILENEVQKDIEVQKGSEEYAKMQEEGINSASSAAKNIFLTEGAKYALVNTLGFRKFLYSNPTSVATRLGNARKGIKEITTQEGRKRLASDAKQFLTRGEKLGRMSKIAAKQTWGGLWTNGTDDMQVDGAEKINTDSYSRYLDAYKNGEAMADTYGFLDGLYSYFQGLEDSMGQSTTWHSGAVGALGSIVNVTPNFANIAHLFTKSGREAYKNNFWRELDRDANGRPQHNEDGSIKYKELGKRHNWRGQAAYFLENGILSEYYGMQQAERDKQSHIDYVNDLLDQYDDFRDIEDLVASHMATENASNIGDEKTVRFLKAIQVINTLNSLANNSSDPASASSVVQRAKDLVEKASQLNGNGKKNPFTDEEINSLLANYYAQHPEVPHSEANSQNALYEIAENAQKLQEAAKTFNEAEGEIQKVEKQRAKEGKSEIDPVIRTRIKLQRALNNHWRERKKTMQSELDDTSSDNQSYDAATNIAIVGGRENAHRLIEVYAKQEVELQKELEEQKKDTNTARNKLAEAEKDLKEAQESDDSKAILRATNAYKDAAAQVASNEQQEKYLEDYISSTKEKKNSLYEQRDEANVLGIEMNNARAQSVLNSSTKEIEKLQTERKKLVKEDGTPKKISGYAERVAEIDKKIEGQKKNIENAQQQLAKGKDKILTAEEIFALDPVSRAKMMNKENRHLYNKEQQREIEKLENELLMKDANALEKIQDIGLLTQRIATSQDAYNRMLTNPEAAAYAVETQRMQAAEAAARLSLNRSADTIAGTIKHADEEWSRLPNASEEKKKEIVFNTLKKYNHRVLDIIDESHLLPQYAQEVKDAREWSSTVGDVYSIINNADKDESWKATAFKNVDAVVEKAKSKGELMSALEQVIDDTAGTPAADDFNYILEGMKKLGYQRDATIIENREKKKQRDEERRKSLEEEKRRLEEEAREAATKKAEEDRKKREAQEEEERKKIEAERAAAKGNEPQPSEDIFTPNDEGEIDLLTEDGNSEGNSPSTPSNTPKSSIPPAPSTETKSITRKRTYESNGKQVEVSVEKVPFNSLKEGEEYINNNGIVRVVEKVADNGEITVSNKDNKNIASIVSPNDLNDADLQWAKEGVDKIVKEENTNTKEEGTKEGTINAEEGTTSPTEAPVLPSNVIEEGDNLYIRSETIDEQFEHLDSKEREGVEKSPITLENAELENTTQGHNNDINVETLTANPLYLYNSDSLIEKGTLVKRTPRKEGDSLDRYFKWMDAAGIKLQNIIDQELGNILQKNPHAKVKFMVVNNQQNATHDKDMESHLMLVLDYDNSINKGITTVHNNDNGGIITANGKKYLVVGVLGYGNKNPNKLAWYDILWSNNPHSPNGMGILKSAKGEYFRNHPTERFYVNEDVTTEIAPQSLIPGWNVKKMEGDTKNPDEVISASELLDKSRNPTSWTLETAPMGIQERSQFMLIGAPASQVMIPEDGEANMGNAFLMVPASNGKMFPSYFRVLHYKEMKPGTLKDKIDAAIKSLASRDYNTRMSVYKELASIFYFDKDDNTILLRRSRPEISFVSNGQVFATYLLEGNFDRTKLAEAMLQMNPRINITAFVLKNGNLRREYDEAGAFMTDTAYYHTAGSSYAIYPVNARGKMVKPNAPVNDLIPNTSSDFREKNRRQVIFQHQYYMERGGEYFLNGEKVIDEAKIKQLQYLSRILDGGLSAVASKGDWNYFILSTGDHPLAVRVNKSTKEVKEFSEEQSKEIIEKVKKSQETQQREKSAEDALKEGELKDTQPVDLGEGEFAVDPETGDLIPNTNNLSASEPSTDRGKEAPIIPSTSEIAGGRQAGETITLKDIFTDKKYRATRTSLLRLLKSKWKDAPVSFSELEQFLQSKDIDVENIGSSQKDIAAWMRTIQDCR